MCVNKCVRTCLVHQVNERKQASSNNNNNKASFSRQKFQLRIYPNRGRYIWNSPPAGLNPKWRPFSKRTLCFVTHMCTSTRTYKTWCLMRFNIRINASVQFLNECPCVHFRGFRNSVICHFLVAAFLLDSCLNRRTWRFPFYPGFAPRLSVRTL